MRIPLFPWLLLMAFSTVFFAHDTVLVSGQCQTDQQSLLIQLKNSLKFNANFSAKLNSWSSNADCCSWGGVLCDDQGRVIGLDLSNEIITDGVDNSSSLFSLEYLQSLNMAFNRFNSTPIPHGFNRLQNLMYLNLSNAGFSGQIPIELSHLTRLVTLDLSTPYSSGDFSLKLENPSLKMLVKKFSELIELHLDGVSITAQGNEWCEALSSSLPKLQVLSLANCNLSGPIDVSLQKLQALSVIHLGNNNLSTTVPGFFGNFSNLNSLRLSSSGLFGRLEGKILQIQTLKILDLSYNNGLYGTLPVFGREGSLQTLVLSYTRISGTIPESISNLKMLSRIELAYCNFSGPIPKSMANLTHLVYLDFSANGFTGSIPSFGMSKNLTQIILPHNQLTGDISSQWEGLENLVNLDLRYNALNGTIPVSLFSLSSLQKLQLSHNKFSGHIADSSNVSSPLLDTIDLSSNNLQGPIPKFVFELHGLKFLSLSSNNFSGLLQLGNIEKLQNLSNLDLSYNNLSIDATASNFSSSIFPQIATLKLASCMLTEFPGFLQNQSKLSYLDLSENQIHGAIPNWIWEIRSLFHLNLSRNFLVEVGVALRDSTPSLSVLDLHANQLQGQILMPPKFAAYLDYSRNNFSSEIPADIGNYLSVTIFFSLSNNIFYGTIPASICNASNLQVLDLSNNFLNGSIPSCLTLISKTLGVLNLRRNSLSGKIPNTFQNECDLQTLDLNGNQLEGKIPRSLANCTKLEVLDLGNNHINDIFPCHLKNISSLRVLVLRSNRFYGSIGCTENNSTWKMLQIVDLASNNFSGKLPSKCLATWQAMMDDGEGSHDHIRFRVLRLSQLYYQDAVTVTIKGLEMELVKILTLFTSIDLSCNNFKGPIPETIGEFKALYVLNLSHNALTGQISPSVGNLQQLESLDLSRNELSGPIPSEVTNLNFLSFLNLSYNKLEGKIPTGSQFQTFSNTSFLGNDRLCGLPLAKKCTSFPEPPTAAPRQQKAALRSEFDWQFIFTGIGFGVGSGAVVAPVMFSKKANKWCDSNVDKILGVIFSMLGLVYQSWDDLKIEADNNIEEENTDDSEDDIDHQNKEFRGRYCVFCSKLDITRKTVIHDPKCTCHHSPRVSISSSSSSSPFS